MTDDAHPLDLELQRVRDFWNRAAADWRTQVGDIGDHNRFFNSDPVLWRFLGDVRDKVVLDAGSGTGYLTNQLAERGARAIGVDLSEEMVGIARATYPGVDYRVDSVSELRTVEDASVDRIVSNYVMMDTPDLDAALSAFHRVLAPRGEAALVFSHPCFPQGRATTTEDEGRVTYVWDFPYFEQRPCIDPPWGHFTADFLWYHRPLSDYWKAFTRAGFQVIELEEPRIAPERHGEVDSEDRLEKLKSRPYSIAFLLRKP
jgi:SAM-dependent methyltransferase